MYFLIKYLRISYLVVLILAFNLLMCQQCEIKGYIYDKNTKEPIPYASITVKDFPYGVTSNKEGIFILNFEKLSENYDTIIISHLGYNKLFFPIDSLKNNVISLNPKEYSLKEVSIFADNYINNRKFKKKDLKNINIFKKRETFLKYSPIDTLSNCWIPTRYKEPTIEANFFNTEKYSEKYIIKAVKICVSNFTLPSKFGLRILKSENGKPGESLLYSPLIITSFKRKEIITVDLEKFNIRIDNKGIFIGFELLILPENQSYVTTDSSNIELYSPFLNYLYSTSSGQSWIYTKGNWEHNNQEVQKKYIGNKSNTKTFYKPAISLVLLRIE